MAISDYIIADNSKYVLDERSNILRSKDLLSEKQAQTKDTFSFKWAKTETYDNPKVRSYTRDWLMNKYFDNDRTLLHNVFKKDAVVLDAGCGSALSAEAMLGNLLDTIDYIGVDISESVMVANKRLKSLGYDMTRKFFIQSDLNDIPLKEKVDVIFSEGVLHHTDSTERAIINLASHLNVGGHFLFYIYVKKGPIREFTDDYVREYFKDKSNEETWNELQSLTKFGKYLGDLNIELDIEEDMPYLRIKKGKINLQRFFYWHIFKCFYKKDYTLDEMNHINFDWYRPLNCHRQTPEQVRKWCEEANLKIIRMHVEEAGITVVAERV